MSSIGCLVWRRPRPPSARTSSTSGCAPARTRASMARTRPRSATGPGSTDDQTVTEGRVLVLNAGSATLKATVLDLPSTHPRSNRTVEWSSGTSAESVGETVGEVIATLADEGIDAASLAAVGHRVVHGGERFTEPTPIDDDVLAGLEAIVDLAPIHQPLAIATIRAAREYLHDVPHIGVFDTAF